MRTSVFKSGDLCDKYRVVRLLATGGQGEVYLAQQEFIERDVALKTVRAPLADSKELHVRMKTEAKLLGKIQHPNVVTVFDAGITTTGVIFIAMELLDGQTLRDSLRAVGRVPIPQAFQVCATIAEGLEAAHEIGVVHRDVKPENVFITNQNATKILDLGTAKIIQAGLRTSRSDAVVGTLWYMAPEQILSNKVTVRSDVYALGLILFEMVGGSHAFASVEGPPPDKYQLGLRQLYSDPTPLPDVIKGFPSYVWDVIAKAIAKDAEQRFASMTEFAAAMRAARRRLVDDVRAQGMIPGNVDLRQRPSPPSTTEIPAIQSSSVDPVPPRVEPPPAAPFGVGPRNTIRISPAAVIATADVEQTARDAVPALVDIAPSVPEPVVERTSPSLPAVHVTPNVMSPAAGVSVSSVPVFDRERQARDSKSGLEVLKALPDADQVRLALYELGQFPNAERFAIDVALAAIPRARGAFALALSSALIDLAGSEAVPKASALAFIREAVSGYAPEALPMLEPFPTFEHRQATDPAPEAAPPMTSRTSVSEVSPSAAEAALAQVTPPPVITPVPVKPAASSGSRRITRAHGIAIGAGLGVLLGAVGILAIWTVRSRSKSDMSSAAAASGVAEVSPAPTSTPSTPAVESSVRSSPTTGASSEPVVRAAPVASGRPSTSSTASLMPTARSEPARAPAAPKVPAGMPGSGL